MNNENLVKRSWEGFKKRLEELATKQNLEKENRIFDKFNLAISNYADAFAYYTKDGKKKNWQNIIYDILSLVVILNFFLLYVSLLVFVFGYRTNIFSQSYIKDFSVGIAILVTPISLIKMFDIVETLFKVFVASYYFSVVVLMIECIFIYMANSSLFSFILILFLMTISIIQLGSTKYFEFICFVKYCEEIIKGYKFVNWFKVIISFILVFFLAASLDNFKIFPFEWRLLILFSLLYLLYVRTLTDLIKISFNLFVYSLYLILLFVNRDNIDYFYNFTSMQFLLFVFSVLFSLERIAKGFSEFVEYVEDKSVLLYLERLGNKYKLAKRKFISIQLLRRNTNLDEQELVQQILIRFHFKIWEEFEELYKLYLNKKFVNYRVLVYQLMYQFLFYSENGNRVELRILENIYNLLHNEKIKQKIVMQEYNYDLCLYIYFIKQDYNLIVKIFENSIIKNKNNFVYLAYCAVKNLGEYEFAYKLQRKLPADTSELNKELKKLGKLFNIETI